LRHVEEALSLTAEDRLAITRRLLSLYLSAAPVATDLGTDEPAEHWLHRGRRT